MSAVATVTVRLGELAGGVVQAEGHDIPFDDQGYTTIDPILPPKWELIIGSAASLIVFALLYKFAWPIIRQSFKDRTARIQKELDDSAAAKSTAETEAQRIRSAKGNIDAERERLYAEADAQAEAMLADGRARLDAEVAELEARADADVSAAAGRGSDELRVEIARHAGDAVDRIVTATLDEAAQQELIEGFIQRVGASTGANA
jgi:F-type H+-transporting ATPase subunit b